MKRIIYRPVNSFIIWKISLMLFEKSKATNYRGSRTGSSRSWGKRGGGGWVNNYTFKQNYHSNGVKLSRSTRTYWSTAKNRVILDHSCGYALKNHSCYMLNLYQMKIIHSLEADCDSSYGSSSTSTSSSSLTISTRQCFRSPCSLELTNTKWKVVYDFTCQLLNG